MYDVIVVGAGPAGLCCAAELTARGLSCIVFEEGGPRDRSEILRGVGGAGLFSDGKFSFYPAGTEVWKLPGVDVAYEKVAALLRRHGVQAPAHGESKPGHEGDWTRKRYPSIYASLAERESLIADLQSRCQVIELSEVHGILRGETGFVVELLAVPVEARRLVIATGRLSPLYLRQWLEPLGVRYDFQRLEFGVRIELPPTSPFWAHDEVDVKLTRPLSNGSALTFCTCRDGEIVEGRSNGLLALSARADGHTGTSSVGLMVRVVDEAIAKQITIGKKRFTGTDFNAAFGEVGGRLMHEALDHFRRDFGVEEATIHGPCIEGVGHYPIGTEDIAIVGDATGRYRGLVASMVSGTHVGLNFGRAASRADETGKDRSADER